MTKVGKTNAMFILNKSKAVYYPYTYDAIGNLQVALMLHQDPK